MKVLLWMVALAGCTESVADNFAKPPPPTSALSVELAAVTLGDDCAPPPPATPKPAITQPPAAAPMKVAPGGSYRGACDQTTMQLVIKTPSSFKAGTVKIKKVELLDADGKLLQTLAARQVDVRPRGSRLEQADQRPVERAQQDVPGARHRRRRRCEQDDDQVRDHRHAAPAAGADLRSSP